MAKLKVKNESTGSVDITLPDGSDKVTIAAGAEADVPSTLLRTDSFRDHLLAGRVSLVKTPLAKLSADQQALGESLMVWLLNQLSGTVLGQYQAMKDAKDSLSRTRLRYNDQHKGTKALITKAKALGPAAVNLSGAAKHFINLTAEQDAVAKVQADIKAKEKEDLAALGKSLETWYAERQALQAKLQAAQNVLAAAQAQYESSFQGILDALDTAATAMAAANPTADIGAEVPPYP